MPEGIVLAIQHPPSWSSTELATRYVALMPELGAGVPTSFHVGTTVDTGDVERFLGALGSATRDQQAWTIESSSGANLTAYLEDNWIVEGRPQPEPEESAWSSWMRGSFELVRALAVAEELSVATLARYLTSEFSCIPAPPIARWNHLVAVQESWVDEAYETNGFWTSWDTVEAFGALRLATRALDAVSEEDWTRAVLPDQLALARAAKPGATRWPARVYDTWQPELIAKPAHGLDVVGYLPDERALELSGYLEPDEHVALGELMTVRALLEAGHTAGGDPLDIVRVIFADRPMAVRERVPLLDAGAEVWYVDRDGRQRPAHNQP